MARTKATESLQKFLRQRAQRNEMWKTIQHFDARDNDYTDNDRAAALILGSILEQALEDCIAAHLIPLGEFRNNIFGGGPTDDGVAPLNTFAAKIWMGYALGIYGPSSRGDLTLMKNIRNVFAHTKVHLSFDDVADACNEIGWPKIFPWKDGSPFLKPETPRAIYFETTRHFFVYFTFPDHKRPPRYTEVEGGTIYA